MIVLLSIGLTCCLSTPQFSDPIVLQEEAVVEVCRDFWTEWSANKIDAALQRCDGVRIIGLLD